MLTPTSCPNCHRGVTFDLAGNKTFHPENWEALWQSSPERLKELGLTLDDIAEHSPVPASVGVKEGIRVCEENLAILKGKKEHWEANKDRITAEFMAAHRRLDEIGQLIYSMPPHSPARAQLVDDRDRVYQEMLRIANQEPTARDAEYEASLEAQLKRLQTGETHPPQTLVVKAQDGARSDDLGQRG
jgi:hypothetical protein